MKIDITEDALLMASLYGSMVKGNVMKYDVQIKLPDGTVINMATDESSVVVLIYSEDYVVVAIDGESYKDLSNEEQNIKFKLLKE